ncbi:MAG: hypothetical protein SFV15_14455 [Polyangiaceae bacterium]|nr:hypothetical protein [Polyangiaceae bacterium]
MAEDPPLHSLAEERSLALHRAVAQCLLVEPSVLEKARARLQDWRQEANRHPYLEAWERILSGTPEDVARALVERTPEACTLRQASPFAGALDPKTRWSILRRPELRDRHAASRP